MLAKQKICFIGRRLVLIVVCLQFSMWLGTYAPAQAAQDSLAPTKQLVINRDALQKRVPTAYASATPNNSYIGEAIADVEIMQGYPTAGCKSQLMIHVGYDDYMEPDGQITRGLVKFNLSAVPAGATINSAQLQLNLVGYWDYPGASRTITAYRISSPWMQDVVTWSRAPTFGEAYGSASVLAAIDTDSSKNWYSFNVTALVRSWQSGAFANYGIGLRGAENSGSDSSWKAFATNATTLAPRLNIVYTIAGAPQSMVIADDTVTFLEGTTPATANVAGLTEQASAVFLPKITVNGKTAILTNVYALLIGIAEYEHMGPAPRNARAGSPGYNLIQPINDNDDLFSTLTYRGSISKSIPAIGYSPANIRTLYNSQATKANIQQGFNWLKTVAKPDTTIVIFFSGHGMTDGWHEYIVPYDVDCNPCGSDPSTTQWVVGTAIRDDELANWLSQVPSQRIVLFFDSCYAGGLIDPASAVSRGLAGSNNKRTLQTGAGLLARVSAPGRVALMASAANQASSEFGELENGVFTYYLIEALLSSSADVNKNGMVSAEEAFTYLAGRVDNYVFTHTADEPGGPYHQNPQLSDGIAGEVDLAQPVTFPGICPLW